MDKWEKRIEEIAMKIPEWKDHWMAYKDKHPEESMPQVMKKASFTRRMWLGKEVTKMIREMVVEIAA